MVYEALRESILKGVFQPDDHLRREHALLALLALWLVVPVARSLRTLDARDWLTVCVIGGVSAAR
jgi:DNA-binding FadR family transcriptional regulator